MKTLKKFFIIAAFACLAPVFAEGQEIDKRLWGVWALDSVEITVNRITQKFTLASLFLDKSKLPRNMFTELYFFKDQIGVKSTETEFVPAVEIEASLKGSFTTKDETLIITMYGKVSRSFTYKIENETLRIWYTEGDIQFYIVYKLHLKTEEQ